MDMGLSTPLNPDPLGDCTDVQGACRTMPTGVQPVLGEHEVPGDLIDFVTTYSSNLALPLRRDVDVPDVLAGKVQLDTQFIPVLLEGFRQLVQVLFHAHVYLLGNGLYR